MNICIYIYIYICGDRFCHLVKSSLPDVLWRCPGTAILQSPRLANQAETAKQTYDSTISILRSAQVGHRLATFGNQFQKGESPTRDQEPIPLPLL